MNIKSPVTIFIISLITLLTFIVVDGESNEVYAGPGHGPFSTISNHGPHIFYPPVVPPGFPHEWFAKDVVQSFKKNKLEIQVVDTAVGTLPVKTRDVVQFAIPSLGSKRSGCIIEFERKENMDNVRKHFLELNKNGRLYTWSYAKDNMLLVLAGSLSREKAIQYEQALYEMKE